MLEDMHLDTWIWNELTMEAGKAKVVDASEESLELTIPLTSPSPELQLVSFPKALKTVL